MSDEDKVLNNLNSVIKNVKPKTEGSRATLLRRIVSLEKSLYDLQGNIPDLQKEIGKVRDFVGMNE